MRSPWEFSFSLARQRLMRTYVGGYFFNGLLARIEQTLPERLTTFSNHDARRLQEEKIFQGDRARLCHRHGDCPGVAPLVSVGAPPSAGAFRHSLRFL